ncbi:MAG: GIY-YIG nuclease family protein, partial [Patescibacteria group bacterium]
GENVFKVGLTRRVDPQERIDELGDASVPFPFDVHAIIPSNNAPELELALHNHLDARKINIMNPRKEFFRVTIDEIEAFVKKRGLTIEFTNVAEAREYRETMSIRQQSTTQQRPMPDQKSKPEQEKDEFPVNPFLSNLGK